MLYLGQPLIENSRFNTGFNELSILRTNFTVPRKKNSRFNELFGAFYEPMFLKYMFKAKINCYPYFKQVSVPSKGLQRRKFIDFV